MQKYDCSSLIELTHDSGSYVKRLSFLVAVFVLFNCADNLQSHCRLALCPDCDSGVVCVAAGLCGLEDGGEVGLYELLFIEESINEY